MAAHKKKPVDKPFLISTLLLVTSGTLIFTSASLGLLARPESIFMAVFYNQIGLGLLGGIMAMIIMAHIDYRILKKTAFPLFIISLIGLVLVFVPGIGVSHGGASRWVDFGFINFQPSEIYKLTFVLFFAYWLSMLKGKVATFKYGTLAFCLFVGVSALFILAQPDTDTFGIIVFAALGMYLTAGARWRDFFIFIFIGVVGLALLAFTRPYVMQRIVTFIDPSQDSAGSGYQIQQSMIAIGSGEIMGKGFGQSVQKFNFLPEPIGDSIFAVAGEEFGFIGATVIIGLYLLFALRALKIAARTPDPFGRLVVVGIVILIISGSFLNISSMLGLTPMSGVPLVFISHGGTALLIAMAQVGIVLNISRYQNIQPSAKKTT